MSTLRRNTMNCHDIFDEIKKNFPATLEETFGNLTLACKKLGISRETVYNWARHDAEFEKKMCEARIAGREGLKDYAEKLHVKHMETNAASVMFTLKCLAKDRGWIEKDDPTIKIVHEPTKTDEEIIADFVKKVQDVR